MFEKATACKEDHPNNIKGNNMLYMLNMFFYGSKYLCYGLCVNKYSKL